MAVALKREKEGAKGDMMSEAVKIAKLWLYQPVLAHRIGFEKLIGHAHS